MSDGRERLEAALPRYLIGEELGRGGWGVVYRAEHRELGRAVAVKQLSPTVGATDDARLRFVSEARLVAGLAHPHIVPVFDFVDHDGICAIVMELASGGSLGDRLRQEIRADEAIAVVLAVAAGLHHAHTHRLLHRDIKPDNVLFADGAVKLTDFGIAKVMGSDATGMTATGAVIGTPTYMAPEQVSGAAELSPATDVYALAVVLYRMLAQDLPYPPVADSMAQLFQHVHEAPRPLRSLRPEVDQGIADVVHRALAKDPNHRPATAEQFAVELAAASRVRLGPGWLARTGVSVMSTSAVLAAAEHSGDQIVRPGAERTVTDGASALPSGSPPPSVSTPAATSPPTQSSSPVPPHAPIDAAPTAASPPARRGGPGRVVAAAAVVGIAVVALAVTAIVRWSSNDASSTTTGSANTPASAAGAAAVVAEADLDRFVVACVAGGVTEQRCGCVADRVNTDLDPEVFQRGLEAIEGDGQSLTPELETVFNTCVADGF